MQIERGDIRAIDYDHLVCHNDLITSLAVIKKHLRNNYPSWKRGRILDIISRFLVDTLLLDPESGSQKATIVVLLPVFISSVKIPKAFLIRIGAQRNFAYTFVLTFPADLPSQIFHLFSN